MKPVFSLLAVVSLALACAVPLRAQDAKTEVAPTYDAALAQKLGGDDYGMKKYVLVLLKTGPKDGEFKDQARADIFAGHMKNIGRSG